MESKAQKAEVPGIFARFMQKEGISPNTPAVVGVSGGADSMALLFCAAKYFGKVTALHVHHGIRESAGRDARLVQDYCALLGIECRVFYEDVPRFARENKLGTEEAARVLRYRRLFAAAREIGARLMVGHHLNDQAETVLFHLLRGAGANGLAGMRAVRPELLRPFLETEKSVILAFCQENNIPFCADETNESTDYTRNFIRLRLLPLCRLVNPQAEKALAGAARRLEQDNAFLFALAKEALEKNPERRAAVLAALPMPVFARAMQLLWKEKGGADLAEGHIAALRAFCVKNVTGARLHLPGGMRAVLSYGNFFLEKEEDFLPFSLPFTGEGVYNLPGGRVIRAEKKAPLPLPCPGEQVVLGSLQGLVLRSRLPGDRISPMNLGGEKKLKDWLIDKKIPRPERDRLVLLARGSQVLTALGCGVAEEAKYNPAGGNQPVYHIWEDANEAGC